MKKIFALLLAGTIAFTGCKKEEETSVNLPKEPEKVEDNKGPEPVGKPKEEEKDPYEGMALNPLTGLYIDEEEAGRRPFAVVINNLDKALPQSGIGQGDIYYEVLAEGGITRLVVVFNSVKSEKIGPIRSTRDYFTLFSLDNNAVFVHHGGSPGGYSAVSKRGIDNIDGMSSQRFFRDKERASKPGMYEHSSYISSSGILDAVSDYGYTLENDREPMFSFNKEDKSLEGEEGNKITLTYSPVQRSYFTYDTKKGLYIREQNESPHIDEETGESISVKNVIVQYARAYNIAGDDAGRIDVDLIGSGSGIYFTKGRYETISWSKSSYDSTTEWFDKNGDKLVLNPGKTFICVFPDNLEANIE